jgi:hypothetical protein
MDIILHHMHADFEKYQQIKDVNYNQITPEILNAKPRLRVKLTKIVNKPRQKKRTPKRSTNIGLHFIHISTFLKNFELQKTVRDMHIRSHMSNK